MANESIRAQMTRENVESWIVGTEYRTAGARTTCTLTLKDGATVTGLFDSNEPARGERCARRQAIDKLWGHVGRALAQAAG